MSSLEVSIYFFYLLLSLFSGASRSSVLTECLLTPLEIEYSNGLGDGPESARAEHELSRAAGDSNVSEEGLRDALSQDGFDRRPTIRFVAGGTTTTTTMSLGGKTRHAKDTHNTCCQIS